MSQKAVAIAVALTLALVVVALMVTNKGTPSPTSAQSHAGGATTFNPALIASISVMRAGATNEERAVRSESGVWSVVSGRGDWPAMPPETFTSALAALPSEFQKHSGAVSPAAGGPTLTLSTRDGSAFVLRLAPSSLAGRTACSLTTPDGTSNVLIENSVLDPLLNPGPAGWRTTQALPGVRDASRIAIDDGRTAIALAKLEGVWSMRRPIAARASRTAVEGLLGALSSIRVIRFEDPSRHDLAAMGLTRPAITISIETDQRIADESTSSGVRIRTITRELLIGGPADPKGDTRFAASDPDGSVLFVVPAAAVDAVAIAPRNYLHPTVVEVSPADVFMVTITDTTMTAGGAAAQRGYRREQGGWTRISHDGSRRPTEAGPVEDLIDFLSSRPGEPEPFRPDDEIRVLRRIELLDADGDAREVLAAGYTADGVFAVRSGNLLVTYRGADTPVLLELPAYDSLSPEPARSPVPVMPPAAPVGK